MSDRRVEFVQDINVELAGVLQDISEGILEGAGFDYVSSYSGITEEDLGKIIKVLMPYVVMSVGEAPDVCSHPVGMEVDVNNPHGHVFRRIH
jgi:hypothetical protein